MKRKLWLTLHLLSAGTWIGVDVIVAVLVAVGTFGDTLATRALAYRALGTFVVWPMLTAGVICLLTGLVLGWTTKWGLLRYWWVAVKLVLNVALCTLILLALQPGMADVRAYGETQLSGPVDPADLYFPPIVSLTLLSFATVLAVYKPWGRIRRGPARTPRRPATSAGRTGGA
jgi:hypothetical protein